MSDEKIIKKLDDLVIYETKNTESVNFYTLRKELVDVGPVDITKLVEYFKQYDPSSDINSVEQQLSLWPHYFRKLDGGMWDGIPVERSSYTKRNTGYSDNNRSTHKPNKRKYKPADYPHPSNSRRVYKDKDDSHFLVIETDTYKKIGPYLKVEAQSVTSTEKNILTELSGKDDLLKVFLKNKDKYIFLGHRSIINHNESPDGNDLTLKFAPAKDDLSIYQIEDRSIGLAEHTYLQQYALALPFEQPEPLPAQLLEKIEADYKPAGTNFQLFKDRYKDELLKLNKKEISAEDFLNWLADEKGNVSQSDYEKILSSLVLKNDFKNRQHLLEIAVQCVNDESSIGFCDDFLNLIIKNNNSEPVFKNKAICFIDVMLLYPEKLEKKHYRKIAKAYAQTGEWNSALRYYAEAYKDGITANDLDMEFRSSLENCDYEEVNDIVEILFKTGLLEAFEERINKSDNDEIFDLVTSFYRFYKDKIKPDQDALESFASSVLSVCSINNEWDNFDLFYDDIESKEKFMKKPEKKFDMLSVGETSGLRDFIVQLSRKYLLIINKNYNLIKADLKKDLVQQIRIFESMMESPDAYLSDWLKQTIRESKTTASPIKTEDILKGFKKIFIIGGREDTRKAIEKRLLGSGAERVDSEAPMSERNVDKKTLRGRLAGYDCVVFLTNYMGHMEYYMGKDIANEAGIRIVHCHGGISGLMVELGKLRV